MRGTDKFVLEVVARDVVRQDRRVRGDSQIVIYSTTVAPEKLKELAEQDSASASVFDQLACRNADRLELAILTPAPVIFVDKAKLRRLFPIASNESTAAWRAFSEMFPSAHGFFSLTLPVYDSSEHEASVYVQWQAGPLAAGGALVRLSLEGGSWKVRSVRQVWSS